MTIVIFINSLYLYNEFIVLRLLNSNQASAAYSFGYESAHRHAVKFEGNILKMVYQGWEKCQGLLTARLCSLIVQD